MFIRTFLIILCLQFVSEIMFTLLETPCTIPFYAVFTDYVHKIYKHLLPGKLTPAIIIPYSDVLLKLTLSSSFLLPYLNFLLSLAFFTYSILSLSVLLHSLAPVLPTPCFFSPLPSNSFPQSQFHTKIVLQLDFYHSILSSIFQVLHASVLKNFLI